jgi:DNA-binding Lrp family transcriptional regulator
MDEKDRLLLTYLQNGLPLVSRPFDAWSSRIGTDTAEILVRIQRLKREGPMGGIKAMLDPRALHYQSAWVAMRLGEKHQVSPEDVPNEQHSAPIEENPDTRLEALLQHPGVIYGCEREHAFHLWFFISVPLGHDLESHVRCLEKLSGAQKTLFLPVRKVFKGNDYLNSLDADTFSASSEHFEKQEIPKPPLLTGEEIRMLRRLQEPFPMTDEPYKKIATDLGITEAEALEQLRSLEKKGCLRRIGGFLKTAVVPSCAKALIVWKIPEEKLSRMGPDMAAFNEVFYADQRPAFMEFPYSFYTLVRASTPEELNALARRIQERIGPWPFQILRTVREFKKEGMKYFPAGLDAWWQEKRHLTEIAFH